MDFGLTDEQRSIVEVTRAFVERELYPHEEEVERTGVLRPELATQIRAKALARRPRRRQHARGGRRRRASTL
jgi:acyl-CoA dehydrogenase